MWTASLLWILTLQATSTEPKVEKVATGFGFVEGPAWDSKRSRLLFSDIPNNRIHVRGKGDVIETFLEPSQAANGLVFDRDGSLYACQGGARRVVKITPDGRSTVLADRFRGKRFNSPNDLALDERGGLYFTDPRYGSRDDLEQDVMGVYYVANDGSVNRVIDSLRRPNGILVSRDGSGLYVAEPDRRELWFFPILQPGRVGKERVLFRGDRELDGGGPDGMALDAQGNVYATYKGIVVLRADGKLVERIAVPEKTANCTFGASDGRTLFITARTSLYRIRRETAGAKPRAPHGWRPPAARRVKPPRFERKVIDRNVRIGYGVAVADVDGDGRPDIVLVARDVVSWYRNPDWKRHTIARKLTDLDHVCVAARDIDGDGMAEVAAGAGWNPGDTKTSGSVHWLVAPNDRSSLWKTLRLEHEPTVHRMRFVRRPTTGFDLVVAPLHGRGNRNGRGAGVRLLQYRRANPTERWTVSPIDDSLHQTHNIDPVQWDEDREDELLVAAREGLFLLDRKGSGWTRKAIANGEEGDPFRGASEVRMGGKRDFVVAIEPFHGNQVVVYRAAEPGSPRRLWRRQVVDATLAQGHALACGDLCGLGRPQIVAGWRRKNRAGNVGLKLYVPLTDDLSEWQQAVIDSKVACEDLRLADLDADGRIDIVASGRASHDLVIFFNRDQER